MQDVCADDPVKGSELVLLIQVTMPLAWRPKPGFPIVDASALSSCLSETHLDFTAAMQSGLQDDLPGVMALHLHSLSTLCEEDVVDFYTGEPNRAPLHMRVSLCMTPTLLRLQLGCILSLALS